MSSQILKKGARLDNRGSADGWVICQNWQQQ